LKLDFYAVSLDTFKRLHVLLQEAHLLDSFERDRIEGKTGNNFINIKNVPLSFSHTLRFLTQRTKGSMFFKKERN
jgi:hypothetical protein